MKGDLIIRNIIGVLLISLFAISITPKSTFHDLIATHKDECFDNHQFKGAQITKQGFSCHFENLVVESPYLWQQKAQDATVTFFFTLFQSTLQVELFSLHPYFSELRGPPCLI